MATREITVTLPKALVEEAEATGLLRSETIERLLREELRRRRVDDLFHAADRLAALEQPPLTEDELNAEIDRARRQRQADHARGA